MVCCVPVSCKANRVGNLNQFGAWRYSDLLAILYIVNFTVINIHGNIGLIKEKQILCVKCLF